VRYLALGSLRRINEMTRILYKRYKSRAFARIGVKNLLNRVPELSPEDLWLTESVEKKDFIVMININKIDVAGFIK
jgi:hypothetical protein